jgi:diguanylate cyclase (GGDEF)-like protein
LTSGVVIPVRAALPAQFVSTLGLTIPLLVAGSVWYADHLEHFVMLQAPAAVLATAWCALMLTRLPRSRRSPGATTVALACAAMAVLWTVYFAAFGVAGPLVLEYPLPDLFSILVRYNPYVDLVTHLALGYGMVLLLMEDVRRETDDAHAELSVVHDQLRRGALHDSVTGSLNRRAFQEGLGLEAARATLGTVVVLDLEDLEAVNDQYGHAAGDALLRYLVEVLRAQLRAADKLYRWGGDEFLLVLPGAHVQQAKRRFQGVLGQCAPLELCPQGHRIPLVVSLGAAAYTSAETLGLSMERAHADMYREKQLRKRAPHYLAPAS